MWVASHLVPTCDAHGYGKFGNCPTLKYIVLCHYMWRWLLASCLEVWARRLCLPTTNNTKYFGCDYQMCYSTCAKGFTLWSVIVGRLRWLNTEGPCVQLCSMSSSQCEWPNWPIFSFDFCWPMMYVVWVIFRSHHYVDLWLLFSRLAYGMFHPSIEEVLIGKWFCHWHTQ
jgi:hypothetical protein